MNVFSSLRSPTFATWVSFSVRAASFVFLYPFVLRGYEQADIAYWLSTSLSGAMLGVIDSGLTQTSIRFFSFSITAHDQATQKTEAHGQVWNLKEVVGTVRHIYRGMTIACFFLSAALAIWVSRNQPERLDYIVGWSATVLSVTAYFWSFQYQSWLQAANKIAELRYREAKIQIGALIFSISLAALKFNIVTIVITNAASSLFLAYLHGRAVFSGAHSALWNSAPRLNGKIGRSFYDSSWKSAVGVLASYGMIQGVSVWYAVNTAPAVSSAFLLSVRLLQVSSQIVQAPFSTKIPRLASLYSMGAIDSLVDVAMSGIRGTMWVLLPLAIGVTFIAPYIVDAMQSKTKMMPVLWLAFAFCALAVERMGAMLVQIFSTSNKIYWHWLNTLSALIALIIGYLAWPFWGDYSIPISWLVCMTTCYSLLGFILCSQLFGRSRSVRLLKAGLLPLFLIWLLPFCAVLFL